MNPFKPQNGPIDRPKRNVYDLSYTSHLTANFGTLYPVFCKKVSPGDSMSIETTFGLRAQPMIFPIQTKMRADIHYFYVRNRTLWNNFMDFYGKTKEGLVHPYIDRPVSEFKTGSIYDYLGVPTTLAEGASYYDSVTFNPFNIGDAQFRGRDNVSSSMTVAQLGTLDNAWRPDKTSRLANYRTFSNWLFYEQVDDPVLLLTKPLIGFFAYNFDSAILPSGVSFNYGIPTGFINYDETITEGNITFELPNAVLDASFSGTVVNADFFILSDRHNPDSNSSLLNAFTNNVLRNKSYELVYDNRLNSWRLLPDSTTISTVLPFLVDRAENYSNFLVVFHLKPGTAFANAMFQHNTTLTSEYRGFGDTIMYSRIVDKLTDSSELDNLPWCGSNKYLKINALPYRAYEAIYNSFYRNAQVTPFKINGVPEYNKYVTNLSDGADTFKYELYQRNFEYDFLTGAFHAPQQGEAPLIGVSVNNRNQTAEFKFSSSQINNGATITATTSINEEGQVIGITGYDPELPQSNIDKLMTAINYGISINDIRQTNALQKWLEKNIRRGYKYKDQLMSHFGVKVEYKELLMPEFIGGVSQDINTDTIYQMATNENGYLGDYAGRAGVAGGSNHRVSKFCDEAGFIIGIISIVPTPVYSQVPAGYAFDNNLFDYFFPEFSKIGMQPIFNYQVTPLQSQNDLDGVFGYQRPYWDLIRSIDEVHGEFRTTANGYIIQRHFAETPELNQHFTEISNDTLSDVFMITNEEVSNQFLGMIHFNCKRKTAIPMYGIPSIE